MKKLLTLFICGVLTLLSGGELQLEICCTADLHGHLDRLPGLVSALTTKNPEILRIDAGDTTSGSFSASLDGGRAMIAALNLLDYQIWVPGNHDFEAGVENLTARCREFRGAVLGADWSCDGFRPLPFLLLRRGGGKIAVIGLTEPLMRQRLAPGSGFLFREPMEALASAVAEVRKQEPDLVILVWHNGLYSRYGAMTRLLRRFPEISLVIGAHSHQEEPGRRFRSFYYVQPGKFAEAAGKIAIRGKNIGSALIRPEFPVRQKMPQLEKLVHESNLTSRIAGNRKLAVKTNPAEAIRSKLNCDAALCTVRQGKTPETVRELFKLLPYENGICTVTLTKQEFGALREEQRKLCKKREKQLYCTAVPEKELLEVALSEYMLCSSKLLAPRLRQQKLNWRRTGFRERQLWEEARLNGVSKSPAPPENRLRR